MEKEVRANITPQSKCVIETNAVENQDVNLWRQQICCGVQRGYDLHVRLVDFSSVLAHLTLKRVVINLLDQQEHLVFLLARTRKLQMVSNTSKTWAGENVFPDLE